MKKILYPVILLLSFCIACNKVDKNNAYLSSLPHLTYSVAYIPGIGPYSWQTNYTIGDTMTLVGVLFMNQPGTVIHIGNADANIVRKSVLTGSFASGPQPIDVVRFLITPAMGTGANRPVLITANGHTLNAPPINISQYIQLQSRTDTTLWVDSIGIWAPPAGSGLGYNTPQVANISSTNDGSICFDNSLGIFRMSAATGQVETLYTAAAPVTENGTTWNSTGILGSVADPQGRYFWFSVKVMENGVSPADRTIYRLCRMDLPGKTITTINRTEVLKAGNNTVAPFEGAVAAVPLAATQLKSDAGGNLYYLNKIRNTGVGIFTKYIINVCRMDAAGKISSLMALRGSVAVPGIALHLNSLIYTVDPQGKTVYALDNTTNTGTSSDMNIVAFDTGIGDLAWSSGSTQQNLYDFVSFDTSALTGHPSDKENMNGFAQWLALPNGDLVTVGNNPSLEGVNIPAKKLYAYAGTEQGVFTDFVNINNCQYSGPGQLNLTGPAKYVRFAHHACGIGGPAYTPLFAGIDPHGTIYYCLFNSTVIDSPVRFYKLYSKR